VNSLFIATYVDIKRSLAGEGMGLLRIYRGASSAESGNEYIHVFQETTRPNRFVVLESWKDQPVFLSHEEAQQTLQFRAKLKSIYSNPYDQRVHHGFAVSTKTAAVTADSVCVVTHVDVPPPRKDEAEGLLRHLAEESRKEAGNIQYDVFQQTSRTNHFTVFAGWKDMEAFDSHELSAHRMEFREALWPILGAPYDERLFRYVWE
jgi:quinol monooxygenase YgiN